MRTPCAGDRSIATVASTTRDVEALADGGRDAQHRRRVAAEPGHAPAMISTSPSGSSTTRLVRRVGAGRGQGVMGHEMSDQLPDEQRVARGAGADRVGECVVAVVECAPGGALDQLRRRPHRRSRRRQAAHAVEAPEIGEQRRERVVPSIAGVAIRAEHGDAVDARRRHVPQQLSDGVVDPVEVVEHQDDRTDAAQQRDDGVDRIARATSGSSPGDAAELGRERPDGDGVTRRSAPTYSGPSAATAAGVSESTNGSSNSVQGR